MPAIKPTPESTVKLIDVWNPEQRGQWTLHDYDERKRPQIYIDRTGEERTRMVGDWDRAEVSRGSGQGIVNIYWLKHKQTGDIQPFGQDTAFVAMGLRDETQAQKRAMALLHAKQAQQRNDAERTASIAEAASPTRREAFLHYHHRNRFSDFDQLEADAALFSLNGKYYVTIKQDAESMHRIGWQRVPLPGDPDYAAENTTTTVPARPGNRP